MRWPMLLFKYTAVLTSLAATVILAGCAGDSGASSLMRPPANGRSDPNLFQVSHSEQFPLYSVTTRNVSDRLDVNGVVAPDVNLTIHVTSLSGGRVMEIRGKLGDEVQKGQTLLVIRSEDLAQAISDYQKAEADESLAEKALARSQDLYTHGALAQKDLQQAEDEAQKSKVDVAADDERIQILGGDPNHLSPIIELKSPIAGTIVEQNVAVGEGVKSLDNSPTLFTVADLSKVWVLCDVYENNLSQVHLGDLALVRLDAYPNLPLTGKISTISSILDPATRTAKVRIELDNRDGRLRPGMFATATFTSQNTKPRLVVPASALLRIHDQYWAFRSEGPGKFRRVAVEAGGRTAGDLQYVESGLRSGDQIVINALQFASTIEQ